MKLRDVAIDRGGLLALVTLVLYAWLAPVTIIDGDNAEFATLGATGGAAHPSGYPLYILWLRAMSWLPGASPAHVAALATAILGALAVLALHAACRAWGAKPLAATVTVAIFASGPVVLRLASEAEVFALNNLVVAAVLWLAAPHGPLRGERLAVALGLVAGLGLANHLTCALVAPIGLFAGVRAVREARRPAVAAALGVAGLAVGLSAYAYVLVADDTPMSWGKVSDLRGVLDMFLRSDYGGPTAFRAQGEHVSGWTSFVALLRTGGRAWLWLPAVVGIGALAVRAARGAERWPWRMLATSWLVSCLLVLRFDVPPSGLGLYVCQRFHVLPTLLLAVPIAAGLNTVVSRFATRAHVIGVLAASLGVATMTALSLPYLGRVHSPAVERSAQNMLRSLPPNAVVLHGQDEFHAATGYVQWVLDERQDVVVVTRGLTALDWYRARLAARGVVAEGSPIEIANRVLASGRPLFVDRLQRELIQAFPSHPYGIVIRLYPVGARLPTVSEVFALNVELYEHFDLDYPAPGMDDEYATEVHLRYRAVWEMIGTMLSRTGSPEAAKQAFALAERLGPRP